MSVASAGIDPGAAPPTSAWWARLAAQPTSRPPAKQGATSVMSLRWVPPAKGSFSTTCSPGRMPSPKASIAARTLAGIDPRCTGMCSACTSISPPAVNRAAEQSARSLMLGLNAARRSTAPISSATPVRREIKHLESGRVEGHAHRLLSMWFPYVTVSSRHSKGFTMIEERARHELYRGVEELLGTDRADTLMSLLPPVGWADVTTKADLRSLDDRIDSRFSRVDAQFSRVDARFTAIDGRLAGIEARLDGMDARFEQLDARFAKIDDRFTQMDARFEQLEGRFEARFAKIDDRFAELERSMAQQTRTVVFSLVGAMLTMTSLCLGTIALAV